MLDNDPRVDAIKDLRQWINENSKLYAEMKKRLDSPKATRQMLLNLKAACEGVLAYNALDPPHVAVFVVAELKVNLEGFFMDLDFAELYEEKKEELKALSQYQDDSEADEEQ